MYIQVGCVHIFVFVYPCICLKVRSATLSSLALLVGDWRLSAMTARCINRDAQIILVCTQITYCLYRYFLIYTDHIQIDLYIIVDIHFNFNDRFSNIQ